MQGCIPLGIFSPTCHRYCHSLKSKSCSTPTMMIAPCGRRRQENILYTYRRGYSCIERSSGVERRKRERSKQRHTAHRALEDMLTQARRHKHRHGTQLATRKAGITGEKEAEACHTHLNVGAHVLKHGREPQQGDHQQHASHKGRQQRLGTHGVVDGCRQQTEAWGEWGMQLGGKASGLRGRVQQYKGARPCHLLIGNPAHSTGAQ